MDKNYRELLHCGQHEQILYNATIPVTFLALMFLVTELFDRRFKKEFICSKINLIF